MTRTIVAAEIGYKDATVSPNVTGTLYMATEGFVTNSTDTLANQFFAGRIDKDLSYKIRLSTGIWSGKPSMAIGAIEIINDDGALDDWADYDFRDQAIVIKQHTTGSAYNSATVLLNAIIEKMTVIGEDTLRFVIRDPSAGLIRPMTTDTYSGNDADGTLKPIAFGKPEIVRPVLVDESALEYAVTDSTIKQVESVYDAGVSVDFNPTTTGFRLVTAPSGKITATVLTTGTGNDPALVVTEGDFTVSGVGKTLTTLDSGVSPQTSQPHGFCAAAHSRASSGGGKYYFEMYIDDMFYFAGSSVGEKNFNSTITGSVAVGVQSSGISNPQGLNTSGLYCLAVGNSSVSSQRWEHYHAWNSATNSSSDFNAPRETIQGTIGVKVDFDAMTIEYLVRNVQDKTSDGPWSIAAATYSPVLGASSDGFDYLAENIASIALVEGDFTYAIPSGYAAWSEGVTADTDFEKLTESITSRISGVTFDSTSVATINALSHSSPEQTYTYSYYLDSSTTAAAVLNNAMSSIGGYWFVNRLGSIQVGQLAAPGTSVRTITDVQITDDISIAPDYADGLTNGLGALRNWSPYRDSEVAGSATEVWKQQITRDYQSEYRSSVTMADGYNHAIGADLPMSLLANATAAQVEADRITGLYATERNFYTVPIAMDSVTFNAAIDDIGKTYTIKSDRFGLSAGKDLVLVGVTGAFLTNEIQLTLWG